MLVILTVPTNLFHLLRFPKRMKEDDRVILKVYSFVFFNVGKTVFVFYSDRTYLLIAFEITALSKGITKRQPVEL